MSKYNVNLGKKWEIKTPRIDEQGGNYWVIDQNGIAVGAFCLNDVVSRKPLAKLNEAGSQAFL